MKQILFAAIGFTLMATAAVAQNQQAIWQDVKPKISNEVLKNPGMGLYLFGTANEADIVPDSWPAKVIDIGYFRDDWAKLQPDGPGPANFDKYFQPIFDLWVNKLGKRVSFRVMSQNMHSRAKYVTPKWVFDQGVPGLKFKGIYAEEQIDPVFWDEKYLQIQEQFIADLGRYLDGRPGLEFIDIGNIGEWGEMHLARWTPQHLEQAGYTPEKYVAAYRRMIDAFARAFPRTRVFLNVGDWTTINDYAALRGIHFRQDGLNPNGPSANVGKRFYHEYSRRGIMANYELHSGYSEMKQKGWGVKETFDKGLEDPISYLHVNLMGFRDMAKAPAEVRDAVTDAARRVGFRFAPISVKCNQRLRVDGKRAGRLYVESRWKNSGVAPCYESLALRWSLLNARGETVVEKISYPTIPTSRWWPGEEITQNDVLSVPAGTPVGEYRLKVAMIKPEEPNLRVQLALDGPDGSGRYDIASFPAVTAEATPQMAYQEGFETGINGWQMVKGITGRRDEAGHQGGALLVQGQPESMVWSYATHNLQKPLLPAARYRLSCWMKVDSISPDGRPPLLKIGLTDATGKWLTNINTNPYDLKQLGTWQQLMAWVETTPQIGGGHLAIEKGNLESRPQISLRLDDVTLELIESP